jgi:hypothetical protein
VITDLRADGRDLLEPDPSWGGARVDTVAALRVTAAHTGEMKLAHWRTVDRWLGMLEEEVARVSPGPDSLDPLAQLLEGLQNTLDGLAANPFLPPGSDAGKRLGARFIGQKAATIRSWTSEERMEAVELVRQLRGLLQARIHDATHPRESLSRCAGLIRGGMADLKEVSLFLQTGRDKPAMEIVITFADNVQALMDILPFLAPDPERARLLAELTPVLRELVAAFDSRDTVLIGDLLEYEIAPRMERIAPLLEKSDVPPAEMLPKEGR